MPQNREEKPESSLATAKIGFLSAIGVALIGAVSSIAVVTIDKVVAPRVTEAEVIETVQANAPKVQFFDELYSDDSVSQSLVGDWQICTLMTAGTVHNVQACTCQIEQDNEQRWSLHLQLDDNYDELYCRCRAACFDFAVSED